MKCRWFCVKNNEACTCRTDPEEINIPLHLNLGRTVHVFQAIKNKLGIVRSKEMHVVEIEFIQNQFFPFLIGTVFPVGHRNGIKEW